MAKRSKGKVKVFGLLRAARRMLLSSATYCGYTGEPKPRFTVYDEANVLDRKTFVKYVNGLPVRVDAATGAAV